MFLGVKGLGLRVFCIDVFAAFSESCSKKAAKFRHYSMSIGFLFSVHGGPLQHMCTEQVYAIGMHQQRMLVFGCPGQFLVFAQCVDSRTRKMCSRTQA